MFGYGNNLLLFLHTFDTTKIQVCNIYVQSVEQADILFLPFIPPLNLYVCRVCKREKERGGEGESSS